ncbi:MAG: plastocyanin/azurin family copper-binding protein [Gemmatimonadota bacterium]
MIPPLVSLVTVLAASVAPPVPLADTVIQISAIQGMHFSLPRFEVAPGMKVTIVFRNMDSQADMPHNLVIMRPGTRTKVITAALQATAKQEYIPVTRDILFKTPLVVQRESFTLTFTAPAAKGAYPYACTFPGHGFVMYGAMYVGTTPPPLATDENVPPEQRVPPPAGRGGGRGGRGGLPPGPRPISAGAISYGSTFPAVSRTFLADNGPASIAVALTPQRSYNFDAGVSYFRQAWDGGFVDNYPHWRGNGDGYADVIGKVWYHSKANFPWRVSAPDSIPEARFLGYRLVQGGYPEFHYKIGDADVRELVLPREGGSGVVRNFEITTTHPLRFITDPEGGANFSASAGQMQGKVLTLTPEQARKFSITMTPAAPLP